MRWPARPLGRRAWATRGTRAARRGADRAPGGPPDRPGAQAIGLDIGSRLRRRSPSPRWPGCHRDGTAAPAASRTVADPLDVRRAARRRREPAASSWSRSTRRGPVAEAERPRAGPAAAVGGERRRHWRAGLEQALAQVAPALRPPRAGLGLSARCSGAVLVDEAGRAAAGAALADRRATGEPLAGTVRPTAPRGQPLVPGMTGPMLAWLARTEPAVLARAAAASCCRRTRSARRWCPTPRPGSPTAATRRRPCCGTSRATGGRGRGRRGGDPAELLPEVRPGAEVVGTTPDDPRGGRRRGHPAGAARRGLRGRAARQRRHRRAGPAPPATRDPSTPRWCTATPTSRTAGTRWPRCRTAARRGRGSAACWA